MNSSPTFSATRPADSLALVVRQVQALTPEISLFRLASVDDAALPAWEAGAHITVRLGNGLARAYSLCSDPAERGHYEIAVQREAAGRGGSQALHREAVPGALLTVGAPRNLFGLADAAPFHLLLGGGIGVTPLLAMASTLARQGHRFQLVVFCRDTERLPLPADWRERPWADAVQLHCGLSPEATSATLSTLLAALPSGGHVYHCGPAGFMAAVNTACAGLPAAQLHSESFGAATASNTTAAAATVGATATAALPPANTCAPGTSVEIVLARQQRSLQLAEGENLAEALHRAGVALDTVCEQGVCGSCVTRYLEGEPIHNDTCLSPDEQREYLAPCCAGSRSPRLVLDL